MAPRRPAYTLFEMIITAAVIAVTASLAVPSLDNMYPSYKMNASVDAIRAAWAQGRAHAIDEGRPYRFAVTPGGSNYRLAPDDQLADGGQPTDDSQGPRPFIIADQLPKGVTFAMAQEDTQSAPQSPGQPAQPPPSDSSTDGMSTVAVFLPDGTARDDAEIRFQIDGTKPKTVKLRGMTGAVTVQQDGGGSR